MAGADPPLPAGAVARKLVFTFVGVFLFAAGLTLVFDGMRAVMEVGGSCGSGGPYEIRQPCPDGVGLIFAGVFGGLIGVGFVVAGTFRGGPKLYTLAWPALFVSLGWNFLEFGIDPPPPNEGLVWGWLVCAVLFIAMGGIPLLFLLWNAKTVLWGSDDGAGSTTASGAARLGTAGTARRPTTVRFGGTTVTTAPSGTSPSVVSPPPPPAADRDDRDLIADLERLSALHRDGQLTDDEFARAKAARLAEEEQ
jgi:hypothetical protein